MKNVRRLLLAPVAVAGVMACDKGFDPIPIETVPLAAVRFVNAVPDTMAFDYRFVDHLTNAGFFDAAFRAGQAQYQPVEAGTHTFRAFLSSTDADVAQQFVNETTFDFAEGGRYTVVHSGYMRSGQTPAATVTVETDNAPTPAAGRVAVRVLNLAGTLGAVDVQIGIDSTAGTVPGATAWSNVPFGEFSQYVEMDPARLRVAATATGTTTPLLVANTLAQQGAPASGTTSPITGVTIPGSVITVVVLPPSVVGSMAPQGFTAPGFVFLNDRRPPDN